MSSDIYTVGGLMSEDLAKIVFAFLDVTDGMKPHDYFACKTEERAEEVAKIRDDVFAEFGKEWIKWLKSKEPA